MVFTYIISFYFEFFSDTFFEPQITKMSYFLCNFAFAIQTQNGTQKFMKNLLKKVKLWLQSLSFRTGVTVLLCCIQFYILSFAQMLLPISAAAKGVLWTVLFGLAKTCQYGGITILGVDGYNHVKSYLRRRKE